MVRHQSRIAVLAVVVAAVAMVFAFASTASAVQQNPECLSCHQSMANWTVPDVDRSTACAKCHTDGLVGTHPRHYAGGNCGAVCHLPNGWGDSLRYAIPAYLGPEGSFATTSSVDTSSTLIHIIHMNPRWPGAVNTTSEKCSSCHGIASCSACHNEAAVPASHAVHSASGNASYTAQAPWTGEMSHGTTIDGDMNYESLLPVENQCATAGCHDVDGAGEMKPVQRESHTHPAYPNFPADTVTYAPTAWPALSSTNYTLQRANWANAAGRTLTSTFPGNIIEVITDVDPYRGQAEVWIDDVKRGEIDCYSPTTGFQKVAFRSNDLGPGNHKVQIRVTGTKNPLSRGTYVVIDGFRAYQSAVDSIAPKCTSCHPDKTASHGFTFSHEATGAAFSAATYSGFACSSCHTGLMTNEHRRDSSKTKADSCVACHTVYAPYTDPTTSVPPFDYSCTWNGVSGSPGCHQVANNQQPHSFLENDHTPDTSIASEAKCRSCHAGNLDVIHNDSVPANGFTPDCLDCHSATSYPASKGCTSGCHSASGVDGMEAHPYLSPAHLGSGADAGVANTGGLACTACHESDLELFPEHNRSTSRLVADGSALNCSTCHDQSYLPRPWNDQCVQCHTTGKAPVPHNAFATKHDYSIYAAANQTSCGGLNCHNVAQADLIHATTGPGNASCQSCHTALEGVPAKKLCTNCHTNHNTTAAHNASLYPNGVACVRCHDGFSTVDTAHQSCVTCHNTATGQLVDYLNDNYTAECTSCHATGAGKLGTVYMPWDPDHYVGTETTHTASSQAGVESGFACNQCHNLEMKPEHITKTKTNFVGVPGAYPDKCVACHQQRVDSLPGGVWNKTCDQCHATKHTAKATQHNATNTNLSGVLTTITVSTTDFETGGTWPAAWTRSNATLVAASTTTPRSGTYAAQIRNSSTTAATYNFRQTFDLSAYESAQIEFWYRGDAIESGDFYNVRYSLNGGTNWTEIVPQGFSVLTWTQVTASLPSSPSVLVSFEGRVNTNNTEWIRYDDIVITGRQRGASPGTAGANCAGSGCHNVADVSVIHNNSITTNAMIPTCLSCHNPSPVTSVKDCNAAGCHNGGHNPAAHTALNSAECVLCHESSNIQAVHPNCDMCHANPTYPGITATNDAECISCHNASEVYAKTYAPSDPNHYVGTVAAHTSTGNGTYNSYQCTQCHQLEMKPEHSKATASFATTTTVIGKCVVCHETKVDPWITAWDKRCASCHPSTHTERSTKHNATAISPGCGGVGCHVINDVAVIHNNSITTNAMTPSCLTCHDTNTSIPDVLNCESAGCHFGMQHGHALDLAGSNYNNTTVTGCTNSGIGCHGSQPTSPTPDYAGVQYHPDNGCQSGACHFNNATQPNAAFNNPQTCQNCHGGRAVAPLNYVNAPDVISLMATNTAPTGGHYNETSHTIVSAVQTMSVGGYAEATCYTCHQGTNPNGLDGMWYQHQVLQGYGNTTCYDCHSFVTPGDVAGTSRVGSAIKNAVATQTDLDCIDCHNALVMGATYVMHETTSSPPATATVMSTPQFQCGDAGCHDTSGLEIHELHKGDGDIVPTWEDDGVTLYNAATCNTPACHPGRPASWLPTGTGICDRRPEPECVDCHDPLLQGWKPDELSCGVNGDCHITSPHTSIGPAHSVTALSQACVDCHETNDMRSNHGYADTENCASANMCHDLDGTVYTYNTVQYTFTLAGKKECADCHALGKMPNVTRNHAPHDPNHYLGSETTHTAISQTGGFGAIYSVVATEGFNSATWPVAWTRNSATLVVPNNAAPLYEGTYHAQIYTTSTTRSTNYFQRTFDTAAVASPTVEFYYTTTNFVAPDYARLEYSTDGTNFTQLWNTAASQAAWTKVGPLAVPRSATLTLRFSASTNANNSDRFRVDAITLKPGDAIAVACNSCHYMELKPEHFKPTAEATRVPGIYPDKCVDCHENKADIIDVTRNFNDWDRTCNAGGVCHTSQHLGQTAKHDATAVSPTCGGSGCHYIKDVAVIHNNSSLSNTTVTTCANTCHTSQATLPTSLACGTAGCHEGMGAHNHELDRDGSLFNPTTVTGCVDSGAGCHGNSATTNYQTYHPNSGCVSGACHAAANHNEPQFNDPNTCMNCHGGGTLLYGGATDRLPVTGVSPDGHYPVPQHTAVASSRTASLTAGGAASARCNQCHNDTGTGGASGIYPQHQGLPVLGNTSCVDCHNYNVGVTAQITGNWTTDTCTDCHNATVLPAYVAHSAVTAPVATATEAQGAGSCQTTGCHTTLDLHALHRNRTNATGGCNLTGCHDFTKQATKPTAKSCGTGGACHTTDSHNPLAHEITLDTGNCLRCHEGQGGAATTDVRNLYKTNGFGLNVKAHGSCSTCHNGGLNLGGQVDSVTNCVYCHTTGKAGTHIYTPYDPNHYYTTSHDSSLTTGANYGTTTQGKTLSDFHGTSLNFERACTTCHTIDLKTEHNKTSIAFNLGGKADKCVACHDLKVDSWSGRWTGSCAGEASSCHSMASLHSDWTTKHNASTQVMSTPGSSFALGSTAGVATENFGTTTTFPTAWTRSSTTYITNQTGSARSGAAAQIGVNTTRTEYSFYRTTAFSLASYGAGTVRFWYQVNVSDTADFLVCEYSTTSGTSGYTELFRVNTDALTWTQSPALSVPGGGNVWIRFRGTFNATGEYGRVDDFEINGVNSAAFGAALPAGSTAAASCQNNPNGTECHNVADVANVHSRTPNNGCPICHTGTAQHATQLNCQATGCHVGVNASTHNTAWHESTFSNTTLFGTGFAASWCNGCHDDSIDNEHFVLGAYASQPCSMCHKKSTNSAAPISVTSVNTSATIHGNTTPNNQLCTDCHTTVTQTRPHVQRWGWTGTPNGGSAAVGNLQFQTTWSGHRSLDPMPGQKTSFTNAVDGVGANRTWSLPSIANYVSNWSPLTESSTMMVTCVDCHGTVTGATGPHGGAMTVRIAAGYTNNYSTGGTYINASAISGNGICAKCHNVANLFNGTANGNVHNRSDHKGTTGGKCINCHSKTPHAWKRPRLIGYRTDPAPYQSLTLNSITDRSYTPTGWSKDYCGLTGCGSHPTNATTPLWP
ncbi:MAG: hypothetical protein U1E26_04505 [Coriobacteriia bacterium]|nr:hypothetical protein [Coriobacteriia bacterium]